jgi:hypothetical protein
MVREVSMWDEEMCEITEADEAATDKETALRNLFSQVVHDETMGVIAMYERAAWNAGATPGETDEIIQKARHKG